MTTQLVLGVVFATQWVLGEWDIFANHERGWFLTGLAIGTSISLAVAAALMLRRSPRVRGAALSAVGASMIVAIGGIIFSFWILRW